MEDWNYSFDAVPKNSWLRQIESDLKGKPIESLFSNFWEGEPFIPVAHEEDLKGEPLRLPAHLFQNPPLLTEYFQTDLYEEHALNQQILQSLAYGTQVLRLNVHADQFEHIESCLTGVMTDIVDVEIEIPFTFNQNKTALDRFSALNVAIRVSMNDASSDENAMDIPEQSAGYIYTVSSTGDWVQSTIGVFQNIIQHLRFYELQGIKAGDFLSRCILQLEADPVYFKQIIQTRTLHFLMQNLALRLTGNELSPTCKYLETMVRQSAEEKSDHFLIRASMSGLAASLSGTHRLCFLSQSAASHPEIYMRASRNIHHLLSLESGMYKREDPLAGAYSLDLHTRTWVEKIWSQISVLL
jgi:hypothetical protein